LLHQIPKWKRYSAGKGIHAIPFPGSIGGCYDHFVTAAFEVVDSVEMMIRLVSTPHLIPNRVKGVIIENNNALHGFWYVKQGKNMGNLLKHVILRRQSLKAISRRWVTLIGQNGLLTSFTQCGMDGVWHQYRPHWQFGLPESCALYHANISTESGPG
jgi:hypothetical protein